MSELCQYRLDGNVAVITMDDGKANALSHDMLDQVSALLERATEADAVVLAGRPGRFSAGFDLAVMSSGIEAVRTLVARGAEVCLQAFSHPRPVVAACTGHALAAGAILLMSTDWRVGADGDFKIGLNEVAIGMPLPQFAVDLARERLSKRHFTRATALAHVYGPGEAVDAGYLDETTLDDPVERAVAVAAGLGTHVTHNGFEGTRRTARHSIVEQIEAGMAADLAHFTVEPPG